MNGFHGDVETPIILYRKLQSNFIIYTGVVGTDLTIKITRLTLTAIAAHSRVEAIQPLRTVWTAAPRVMIWDTPGTMSNQQEAVGIPMAPPFHKTHVPNI